MSQTALLFTLVALIAWYATRLPGAGREGMRDPKYAKKTSGGGGGVGWMSGWSRTPAPGSNGRGYGGR